MKSYQDKYWEHLTKGHKKMKMLNANVRKFLYVMAVVVTPTMAYLFDQGVVNSFWFGLWTVVSMAIFGLAKVNVTPDEK